MYKPFKKVVLRFPYHPISVIKEASLDSNYFEKIIKSDHFQKAIYLASPELYDELLKYYCNQLKEKDRIRLKNSLMRYLARMSTRCTPFGLFASCSVGEIGSVTKIILKKVYKESTRLDMLYLCALSQQLAQMGVIRNIVKYYVNSSLYRRGNKYRYIEYKFENSRRLHQLVEVKGNQYLTFILKQSIDGIHIRDLVEGLMNMGEISKDMAESYIQQIINSQILVSEIDPIITGGDYFNYIISIVTQTIPQTVINKELSDIKKMLDCINNESIDSLGLYTQIENRIQNLNIPFQRKYILQTDLFQDLKEYFIGEEVINTIQKTLKFLNKITPYKENELLIEFKNKFIERYESAEIPILEALDPEIGIGFPVGHFIEKNSLLDGLIIPHRSQDSKYNSNKLETILDNKLFNFNPLSDNEIVIEDNDIKELKENWENIPATIFTKFTILDQDPFSGIHTLQLDSFNGSSAANLLGRFAYYDKEICELVNEITEKEEEILFDYTVAEISHIPDSRVGNILARPNLHKYEILYLANSSRSRREVIYLSDIMVSVKNNQVILRSKMLDQYIIPRLSTAHNFHNSPTPVYRFLCSLQTQNLRSSLFFSWGRLSHLKFLPRVRYDNVILSLARWSINVKSIIHLIEQKEHDRLIEDVQIWRKSLNMPQYLVLEDGDNTLFIDLESIYSLQAFFDIVKKRIEFSLTEFLENRFQTTKDEFGNQYTNECIISFYKDI